MNKNLLTIEEGDTDTELTHVDLRYIRETYSYPHMVVHRASLATALFNACKRSPSITFNFSTTISPIHTFSPLPTFSATPRYSPPYTVTCSILLACDGVKSPTRTSLLTALNAHADILDTSQAAYRIMLSRAQLTPFPHLLALLDSQAVTRWIGPSRHIIAYPVSSHTIYNISTVQPDTNFAAAPSATYTTRGSKTSMLETFSDFCPRVQEMLQLVPDTEVCEWKLRVHPPLPTWIHGCVALVGDAAHPTLPHLAQGAAQAIEDAAVLGVVLSKCPDTSPESINKSLKVYEKVRKERAEILVELAAQSGRELHLGEGKAREERDRVFREGGAEGKVPDKWADREVQGMVYGFDCVEIAEGCFEKVFRAL